MVVSLEPTKKVMDRERQLIWNDPNPVPAPREQVPQRHRIDWFDACLLWCLPNWPNSGFNDFWLCITLRQWSLHFRSSLPKWLGGQARPKHWGDQADTSLAFKPFKPSDLGGLQNCQAQTCARRIAQLPFKLVCHVKLWETMEVAVTSLATVSYEWGIVRYSPRSLC